MTSIWSWSSWLRFYLLHLLKRRFHFYLAAVYSLLVWVFFILKWSCPIFRFWRADFGLLKVNHIQSQHLLFIRGRNLILIICGYFIICLILIHVIKLFFILVLLIFSLFIQRGILHFLLMMSILKYYWRSLKIILKIYYSN